LNTKPLSSTEFIFLIAMLFATVAFSIDSMLPALPQIAAELVSDQPNRAQLIIASFVFGMGVGTLFAGPLSDSYGRKTVILAGGLLYIAAAGLAYLAPSLDTILAARFLQGLGAAAPRIVALALVRDLYKGRDMARIVSIAMMIFTLVPAVAPLLGQTIIAHTGWRGIFVAFMAFSIISMIWLGVRQPETLLPPARRPFRFTPLLQALVEVLSYREVRLSILAQTFAFGGLIAAISSVQPIFEITFDRAESFPLYFAGIALASGLSSLANAALVVRFGMRRMVTVAFAGEAIISAIYLAGFAFDLWPQWAAFPAFLLWTTSLFFMVGLSLGNLNALAMEPAGHIAGMAASVIGCVATVGGVMLAAPVGQMFDGTPLPLVLAVTISMALAYLVMLRLGDRPVQRA
jgi:MFS transporter, DHA1 family, multidrug resistance protein